MGKLDFFENIVEQKLMNLHTCFLAKVISTDGNTAKIQPLGKSKQYGETAINQSPLSSVPIANSAKWKYTKETITYVKDVTINTSSGNFVTGVGGGNESPAYASSTGTALTSASLTKTKETKDIVTVKPIATGNIVVCVCGDRNITEARKGNNATPPAGHHSMSDSIIVAIL